MIHEVSVKLQEQTREELRVALFSQPQGVEQGLICLAKGDVLRDEMHLLRCSATVARRVRPIALANKIGNRLARGTSELVSPMRPLRPEPVIRDRVLPIVEIEHLAACRLQAV